MVAEYSTGLASMFLGFALSITPNIILIERMEVRTLFGSSARRGEGWGDLYHHWYTEGGSICNYTPSHICRPCSGRNRSAWSTSS